MAPTLRAHDVDLHAFVRQLDQHIAQHFDRALHIALEDDEQFLLARSLELLRQTFERNTRALRQLRFTRFALAIFGDATRLLAIGDGDQLIAGLRQSFQTENLDRSGRPCCFQRDATIVKHGAHFAEHIADNKVVAVVQRSVLYQHGRHRTTAAIELGFQHGAARQTFRHSLQIAEIGNQADHLHQQIEIGLLLRRNIDEHRAAAPVFRHQAAIGQLLLDALGHGIGLIDLVDRDDDRHVRRLGVIDSFQRLRHHAVIGCNHQHNDVRHLRSASTHASKRFVTRGIEEDDLAAESRRIRDR